MTGLRFEPPTFGTESLQIKPRSSPLSHHCPSNISQSEKKSFSRVILLGETYLFNEIIFKLDMIYDFKIYSKFLHLIWSYVKRIEYREKVLTNLAFYLDKTKKLYVHTVLNYFNRIETRTFFLPWQSLG